MKNAINFDQLKQQNAVAQAKNFTQTKFWWARKNNSEAILLFDVTTKKLYSSKNKQSLISIANNLFPQHQFWFATEKTTGQEALLNSETKLIWDFYNKETSFYIEDANKRLKEITLCNVKNWRLPSFSELANFVTPENNPWRSSKSNYRLFQKDYWLYNSGRVDLDSMSPSGGNYTSGFVLSVNNVLQSKLFAEILTNWSLESADRKIKLDSIQVDTQWVNKSYEQIILDLENKEWTLKAFEGGDEIVPKSVTEMFKEMDYRSVRLPKLEDAQFTKGFGNFGELTK